MNSAFTNLKEQAVGPFTHILLSLELLENEKLSDECRSLVNIIHRNTERLRNLILQDHNAIAGSN